MAFLRRKGNTFYLVHNVREGDRVKQLHLAKLGERPRITDDVVRQVTREYPFVDVNWNELREQVNNRNPTRFRSSFPPCALSISIWRICFRPCWM